MRILLLSVAFSGFAFSASAGQLSCFYNPSGEFTGADGGSQSVPEAQWDLDYAIEPPRDHGSDAYAYVIVLSSYESGNDCPASAEIAQ